MTRCFVFKTPVPYPDAVAAMEERIVRIRDGRAENAYGFQNIPTSIRRASTPFPACSEQKRFLRIRPRPSVFVRKRRRRLLPSARRAPIGVRPW